MASQEANMLSDLLQTLDGDRLATLAPIFLTKAETLIADPWAMSVIPDFVYLDTIGEPPTGSGGSSQLSGGIGAIGRP